MIQKQINLFIIGIKSLFQNKEEKERECESICSLLDTKDPANHIIAIELIKNKYSKWYAWLDYIIINRSYVINQRGFKKTWLLYSFERLENYHYYTNHHKESIVISSSGEKRVI